MLHSAPASAKLTKKEWYLKYIEPICFSYVRIIQCTNRGHLDVTKLKTGFATKPKLWENSKTQIGTQLKNCIVRKKWIVTKKKNLNFGAKIWNLNRDQRGAVTLARVSITGIPPCFFSLDTSLDIKTMISKVLIPVSISRLKIWYLNSSLNIKTQISKVLIPVSISRLNYQQS